MTYYDDIYERAVDENYLITTAEAREIGVPAIELAKLAHRGRLDYLGNGVYRLARFVPSATDPYAVAVKRLGKGAFLHGESVIALLDLAPTNPARIYVATPTRVRRTLPEDLYVIKVPEGAAATRYEGIPCQPVADALRSCASTMMPERIREAAEAALAQGYLPKSDHDALLEEIAC